VTALDKLLSSQVNLSEITVQKVSERYTDNIRLLNIIFSIMH